MPDSKRHGPPHPSPLPQGERDAEVRPVDLVFIVPHTHWDREWYLPFERFRARLVQVVDRLLTIMRTDPSYERFTLDGQSIVLDDYLAIRPEQAPLLRDLVAQGRMAVGPWYVLPDEFLVSGEALVRNLQLGRRRAAAFGRPMAVGYLPDSFGHIAQMPQILRGFGIGGAMLSRGVGDEGERLGSEFWWEALDGSRVLCIHQVRGYCNLVALGYRDPADVFNGQPPDPPLAVARVRREVELLAPYVRAGVVLLNNGCDHQPASPHLPELIARLREALPQWHIRWGHPEEVIAEIVRRSPALGVHRGELRGSRYAPLIPGVLSTRVYLKQANEAAQTTLERWAEPFGTIAWALGGPPPGPFLAHAWELLLQNHPHDSICGCSADAVHREMLPRFARVTQVAEELTTEALAAVAARIDTAGLPAGLPLVVFNALNWPRTGILRTEVVLPATMLPRLRAVDAGGRAVPLQILSRVHDALARERIAADHFAHRIWWLSHEIELAWGVRFAGCRFRGSTLVVETAEPGVCPPDAIDRIIEAVRRQPRLARNAPRIPVHVERVRLTVALLARDVPPVGYATFVLTDRGAPAAGAGGPWTEIRAGVRGRGATLDNGRLTVQLKPTGEVVVRERQDGQVYRGHVLEDAGDAGDAYDYSPVDDRPIRFMRRTAHVERLHSGPVLGTLRARLEPALPVEVAQGRRRRTRRRVVCPVDVEVTLGAESPIVEFAARVGNRARDHRLRVLFPTEIPVDHVIADVQFGAMERSIERPPGTGWAQPPQPTAPHESWIDVSDGRRGLAVLSRGLHEHEAVSEPGGVTVALTLLRCVGWLSRDDLRTRAAHAGPGYATPEAQCLGDHEFHYALYPHGGRWDEADVVRQALTLRVPLRAVAGTRHDGSLPPVHSFLRCDGAVVTAVKPAEDGRGLVVRCFNAAPGEHTAVLETALPCTGAREVNLTEEHLADLERQDSAIRLKMRPFQIRTLVFDLGESRITNH